MDLKRIMIQNPTLYFQSATTKDEVLTMFDECRYPNTFAEPVAGISITPETFADAVEMNMDGWNAVQAGHVDLTEKQRGSVQKVFERYGLPPVTQKYAFSSRLAYYDLSTKRGMEAVKRCLRRLSNCLLDTYQAYSLYDIPQNSEIVGERCWKWTMPKMREPENIFRTGVFLYAEERTVNWFCFDAMRNLANIEYYCKSHGIAIQPRASKSKRYSQQMEDICAYPILRDELEDLVRRYEKMLMDAMYRARLEAIEQENDAVKTDACERLVSMAS